MTQQLPLLGAPTPPDTGARRLAAVRERQESLRAQWLAAMRAEARRLAEVQGTVTADDLRPERARLAREQGLVAPANTAGAIFLGAEWEQVGWTKSRVPEAHRNDLRVWRRRAKGA